jgi:hypothetical protein
MTKRTASANRLFAAAEATLIGLYDGGVLSPAVLERVIAGFAGGAIDWHSAPRLHTVDGKSLHEVVAMTMMPGRTHRSASKEFFAVVEHIGGGQVQAHDGPDERDEPEEEPGVEPDDDLISQLSGGRNSKRPAKPARKTAASTGFNPLLRATSPSRTAKS